VKTEAVKKEENWGILELLRGPLGPVVSILKPLGGGNIAISIIVLLLLLFWVQTPGRDRSGSVAYGGIPSAERMVAYEEMWRRQESELWDWLEDRAGVDGVAFGAASSRTRGSKSEATDAKAKLKQRKKIMAGKDIEAKLREEKMSLREMEDAIELTQTRLHVLQEVLQRRKDGAGGSHGIGDGFQR